MRKGYELGLRRLLFLDSTPARTDSSGLAGARLSAWAENDVMLSEVEALKFLSIEIAEASCLGATAVRQDA